jgi:hypothetical protein
MQIKITFLTLFERAAWQQKCNATAIFRVCLLPPGLSGRIAPSIEKPTPNPGYPL